MIVLSTAAARVICEYGPPARDDRKEHIANTIPETVWAKCQQLWEERNFTDGVIRTLPVPKGMWKYRAILFRRLKQNTNEVEFPTFVWERMPVMRDAVSLPLCEEDEIYALGQFARYAQEQLAPCKPNFWSIMQRVADCCYGIRQQRRDIEKMIAPGIAALLSRTALP